MKLITANVNGRVEAAQRRQFEALMALSPDVLCLQEVTRRNYVQWIERLAHEGFSAVSTVDLIDVPYPSPPYPTPPFPPDLKNPDKPIQRTYFNLTAARHPIAQLPGLSFQDPDEAKFAFPEKYLAAQVRIEGVDVEVHNAHLPPGVSRGRIKVQALNAIAERVRKKPSNRILCGDFNELPEDGDDPFVFEGDSDPTNAAWGEARARIFSNPKMREVYRDVHQRGEPFPVSHRTGWGIGKNPRRYDHIFASADLVTEECRYHGDWLDKTAEHSRLSDHAPVEAVLVPKSA